MPSLLRFQDAVQSAKNSLTEIDEHEFRELFRFPDVFVKNFFEKLRDSKEFLVN